MSPSAVEDRAENAAKKARRVTVDRGSVQRAASSRRPKLFQPFRALGLVTDSVPFVLRVRHGGKDATKPDVQLLTCIGSSWLMWDADRMTLQFVGEPLPGEIRSLIVISGSSGRDSILASSGRSVYRFIRGKLVDQLDADEEDGFDPASRSTSDLLHLLAVGDNIISLDSNGSTLFVWSLAHMNLLRRIKLNLPVLQTSDSFKATAVLHPSTYVDKVLLGSAQGHLQLYNFRTSTLLHTFTNDTLLAYMGLRKSDFGKDASLEIVDLVQTPAIDVVGVVFAVGYVLLMDIRYDEPILFARVGRDSDAQRVLARSCVSFRTDTIAHTMAIGTQLGDIVLFDLENTASFSEASIDGVKLARPAQLAHTIRSAHQGAVASVQFLQGQSLLISSGTDNAIRQWFFEVNAVSGTGDLGGSTYSASMTVPPRLLKSREGHSLPPRIIRYVGEGGKVIVSAGGDDRSVRAISVVRDSRSAELSQGSVKKKANKADRSVISLKLPPATSVSHSSTRTRDWDDLVTTHEGMKYAQSWSTRNARIGANHLHATTGGKNAEQSEATTSQVSACGNFAIVGNRLGFAEMYNIQSSRYRARFDTRSFSVQKVAKKMKSGQTQWKEEHVYQAGSPVTGIVSDSVNRFLVLSTAEGLLSFFDFHTHALIKSIRSRAGIVKLLLHRPTNLIAAAHRDRTISLYDLETHKLVRLFSGFTGDILDLTFSPDGRWLIASAFDGFVRTFDIPTSRLIDFFQTTLPAIGVSFSPLGDFLATVHQDSRGIYLWANRNQYLNLPLSGIDENEVVKAGEAQETLPTLRGLDVEALADEDAQLKELDVGEAEYQRTYTSVPQLFVFDALDSDDLSSARSRAGLVTLSTMPRSRWMTLLNLDVIKARNKPKEAPKKPQQAPFFLPVSASSIPESAIGAKGASTLGLADQILADNEEHVNGEGRNSRRRVHTSDDMDGLLYESDFARRLAGALQEENVDGLFVYLHALSPPALDGEIRSLTRIQDLTAFLQCMTKRLEQHLDYDAVQAMVAVALRIHGDVIVANGVKETDEQSTRDRDDVEDGLALAEALRALMAEQYREGNRLLDLVQYCMGTLAFVRDMPLV